MAWLASFNTELPLSQFVDKIGSTSTQLLPFCFYILSTNWDIYRHVLFWGPPSWIPHSRLGRTTFPVVSLDWLTQNTSCRLWNFVSMCCLQAEMYICVFNFRPWVRWVDWIHKELPKFPSMNRMLACCSLSEAEIGEVAGNHLPSQSMTSHDRLGSQIVNYCRWTILYYAMHIIGLLAHHQVLANSQSINQSIRPGS